MEQKISAISALTGSISKKELEFGGHFYPLPVKDITVGEIVLVHIWGMNTSPTDEKLGIWWKVTGPAGEVVEEYLDWQSFNTDPGGTHHFIGGRFTLSEEGRYMIFIKLYIYNPDSWSFFKGKLATFVYSDYVELCSTVAIPEEEISFSLTKPTASPSEVYPGDTVSITCPIKSNCTNTQSVTARLLIYEGSVFPGHGALLTTKSKSFSISPGATYNARVSVTAVAGTIDRRDVKVEIYIGSTLVKESEWDDIYYVLEKEIEDWVLLGSTSILVSPIPVAVDWILLGSTSILVSPILVQLDWVLLGSTSIIVIPLGVEPPPLECTIDADCPPGYVCVNGKCVLEEEEEEEKEFPWLWVAGGLGVAAVVVAAATEKKPAKGGKP